MVLLQNRHLLLCFPVRYLLLLLGLDQRILNVLEVRGILSIECLSSTPQLRVERLTWVKFVDYRGLDAPHFVLSLRLEVSCVVSWLDRHRFLLWFRLNECSNETLLTVLLIDAHFSTHKLSMHVFHGATFHSLIELWIVTEHLGTVSATGQPYQLLFGLTHLSQGQLLCHRCHLQSTDMPICVR